MLLSVGRSRRYYQNNNKNKYVIANPRPAASPAGGRRAILPRKKYWRGRVFAFVSAASDRPRAASDRFVHRKRTKCLRRRLATVRAGRSRADGKARPRVKYDIFIVIIVRDRDDAYLILRSRNLPPPPLVGYSSIGFQAKQ